MLGTDISRLAVAVMLIVSHEEEVIVVARKGLHVIIVVERFHVLCDIHIVVVEEL